jgi:hypothetical protein
MTLLLLLTACEFSIESYLRDVREPSEELRWEGFVYQAGPLTGESAPMETGSITLSDLDESWTLDAEQPYESYPGWWRFEEVPKDAEVFFRVEAEDQVPMVWRARSPEGDSRWLDYGLYTMDLEEVDGFIEALSTLITGNAAPLSEGEVAHLWGSAWDPEAWVDAELLLLDDNGDEVDVLQIRTDEESGAFVEAVEGEPIELFYAFDLPPGQTTLHVTSCDGLEIQIDWPTRAGDLLSALYTTLPESP